MTKIYHFDRIVKNYLPLIGSASVKLFLAQALAEDRDAGSEPFGGRWGRGMPQQAGCVAQGVTEHFQAKWLHLAARKMRSNKQLFSSQVATLGGSEKTFRIAYSACRMNGCEREPLQGKGETTMKARISRRTLTGGAFGLLSAPALVSAQDAFPNRPITLVVPSPAGGGTDFSARLIADQLGRALGGSMVVENRPGRGCAGRQNHRRLSFSARAMRPFTVT